MVGFQTLVIALLIGLFAIAASVVFHAYWATPAEQQFITQLLFMKSISVAGGMFLISALGAGPVSMDAARFNRAPPPPAPNFLHA